MKTTKVKSDMNTLKRRIMTAAFSMLLVIPGCKGCIDDDPVKYNEYGIEDINPPVDKTSSSISTELQKRVHIGHDLPVSLTMTAKYAEDNVPIQFYLLNVNDINEVENGIGSVADIRSYYCQQTPLTTIDRIVAGTGTYDLIVNIPAEDGFDRLTGDYKTGRYYVLADVNKYDNAEIDIFEIYEKFKGNLNEENIVEITSDYLKKPDLSIEEMHFTGTEEAPNDVVVFYNLILNNLPGGEDLPTIFVEPSQKDRTFTGTVHVKSSSSDALNVPIKFSLKDAAGTINIPLEIYDRSMKGYVDEYYIPLLKANTTERITLALRIPADMPLKSQDKIYYFQADKYDDFASEDEKQFYYLSQVRHAMEKGIDDDGKVVDAHYRGYGFQIVAEVNPGGKITEARFIAPKDDSDYSEDDYYENGDIYDENNTSPSITKANNTMKESLNLVLQKIEVQPNEGIKQYPCSKISGEYDPNTGNCNDDSAYKTLVIFWDGFDFSVGDDQFGATAEAHEGMFFYNYSLYSFGVDVHGSVLNNKVYLINTYLDAESHPGLESKSGFEFHIEGGFKTVLSEAGTGFSENNWEYPILLYTKEKSVEKWVYCFKFTLTGGVESYLTPGLNLNINSDGSLFLQKYFTLTGSAYADASASIAGLATVGLYTYLDVLTLLVEQNTFTETSFDSVNYPGKIKGTLNRNLGIYLLGPKGYIDIYFEIDFVLFSKRWSKEIYSYSTFKVPLLEFDFTGSGNDTNWIYMEDNNIGGYSTPDDNDEEAD